MIQEMTSNNYIYIYVYIYNNNKDGMHVIIDNQLFNKNVPVMINNE